MADRTLKLNAFGPAISGSYNNCSICDSDYDPDRGGIQGHFGIMPVTFCEWCYSSIMSMAEGENRS